MYACTPARHTRAIFHAERDTSNIPQLSPDRKKCLPARATPLKYYLATRISRMRLISPFFFFTDINAVIDVAFAGQSPFNLPASRVNRKVNLFDRRTSESSDVRTYCVKHLVYMFEICKNSKIFPKHKTIYRWYHIYKQTFVCTIKIICITNLSSGLRMRSFILVIEIITPLQIDFECNANEGKWFLWK